jgi:hypothetical protein
LVRLRPALAGPLLAFTLASLAAAAPVAVKVRQFVKQPGDSVQGMAITADGHLLQGGDGGQCRVYDLNSPADTPIAEFRFASAGRDNHANALSLGDYYQGGAFPLVYVTGGQPASGVMECHVENIRRTGRGYAAERVQRITLAAEFAWDMKPESPYRTADGFYQIWGAPSWLIDSRAKCLYTFSAVYRTTAPYAKYQAGNRYIVTKLRLPAVSEGDVTLTRQDVLAQTVCDFDVFITQSGCVHEGELYYAFGFGRARGQIGESQMRAYDLETGRITRRFDLTEEIPEELEACSFYQGELYVVTQNASLYKIRLFR